MKFILEIDCDNESFQDRDNHPMAGYEVARILRDVARRLDDNRDILTLRVRDSNGNTVGIAQFVEE